MTVRFHADDYGITPDQARDILALSSACGGTGALSSVSIFANSPAFPEVAALALPSVEQDKLLMGLHLNLVEGVPCAHPSKIPLLLGERGTFCNDFVGLLKLSKGPHKEELRSQIEREFTAQLTRYLSAFPTMQHALRIDSHQHTHAIPLVFDALLTSTQAATCTLSYVRLPAEPLRPYRASKAARKHLSPANFAKKILLSKFCRINIKKLPRNCTTSLFCGVLLSGRMDQVDAALMHAFEAYAQKHATHAPFDGSVEVLFHPVSVPLKQCLDPANSPFAAACASSARDTEAQTLSLLS